MTRIPGDKRRRRKRLILSHPRCVYCGIALCIPGDPETYTAEPHRAGNVDHVLPWSRGGRNDESNMVPACIVCNQAKADRTPEEWAADIIAAAERIAKRTTIKANMSG